MISTVFSAQATVGRCPISTAHRILFRVSMFMQMASVGPNRACVPAFCICSTFDGLPSRRRRIWLLPCRVSCIDRDQTPWPPCAGTACQGSSRWSPVMFGCMPRSKAALSSESESYPVSARTDHSSRHRLMRPVPSSRSVNTCRTNPGWISAGRSPFSRTGSSARPASRIWRSASPVMLA